MDADEEDAWFGQTWNTFPVTAHGLWVWLRTVDDGHAQRRRSHSET